MQLQIHLGRCVIWDLVRFHLPYGYLNGWANETWPPLHYPWVLISSINTPPAPVTVPGHGAGTGLICRPIQVLASVCWLTGDALILCLWCALAHSAQRPPFVYSLCTPRDPGS